MSTVSFQGTAYPCLASETVLECLTRHGVAIPSSCRSGVCQTCLLKAIEGQPPGDAQKGLNERLRKQNYFMSCICRPESDIEVALPGTEITHHVSCEVVGKVRISPEILRLNLRPQNHFDYLPGQFLNLFRPDGLVRSYSLASLPQHNEDLELHIRVMKGGQMTGWIDEEFEVGDKVDIEGAIGDCVYSADEPEKKLLLVGTGTGLAPLWGILRDALDHGHNGSIHLFHGSYTKEGLYFIDQLREMERQYPNFHYTPCVDQVADPGTGQSESETGFVIGQSAQVAMNTYPDLKGWRVYLCGHADMVADMKRKTYIAGASLSDIHADAFVCSPGNPGNKEQARSVV